MKNDKAKEVIVATLQKSLIGHLDPSSNFNPIHVADAIVDKVNFEKEYTTTNHERIIKFVIAQRDQMEAQTNLLSKDEVLLKNFIKGKITAYNELLAFLKS